MFVVSIILCVVFEITMFKILPHIQSQENIYTFSRLEFKLFLNLLHIVRHLDVSSHCSHASEKKKKKKRKYNPIYELS